ncbi:MAG: endonuclease domain-containing protein, partial [Actinomycetota bacterium]
FDGCVDIAIEMTSERPRKSSHGIIVHTSSLPEFDVMSLGPLTITTPTRTLVDLSHLCNVETVEMALEDALRRRLTSLPRLKWALETEKRRRGLPVLRSLIAQRTSRTRPTESAFETKLFSVLRRAGLPLPERQYEIWNGPRFVARVDFAYPEQKLIIEADSFRFHSGRKAWGRDATRGNALVALGHRILRITYEDVNERPGKVADMVGSALGRRSLF